MAQQDIFEPLFPTFLGVSLYPGQATRQQEMLDAVYALREQDDEGRRRSAAESPIGYTSYFTQVRMMEHPAFQDLTSFITEKAHGYARQQRFDLNNFQLLMSTFWVNIQPRFCFHAEHIHPYSHISGVYYLSAPPDSGEIVFKDPRPVRTMSMPPYTQLGSENSDVFTVAPAEGHLLLFPSWLTHAVRQNNTEYDRISLSFNFELVARHAPRPGGLA